MTRFAFRALTAAIVASVYAGNAAAHRAPNVSVVYALTCRTAHGLYSAAATTVQRQRTGRVCICNVHAVWSDLDELPGKRQGASASTSPHCCALTSYQFGAFRDILIGYDDLVRVYFSPYLLGQLTMTCA